MFNYVQTLLCDKSSDVGNSLVDSLSVGGQQNALFINNEKCSPGPLTHYMYIMKMRTGPGLHYMRSDL